MLHLSHSTRPLSLQIGGNAINLRPPPPKIHPSDDPDNVPVVARRLLKPLPTFGGDMELRNLGETIQRDILQNSPNVKFSDIIELDDAKRLLKEAVVMPLKYPQLFTGLLSPWCGILLYVSLTCVVFYHSFLNFLFLLSAVLSTLGTVPPELGKQC